MEVCIFKTFQRTLNLGIGAVGLILIGYGCLGLLQNGKLFLGLAFTMRIFEACGNSMFLTGSFSAIAREFPDKVTSSMFTQEISITLEWRGVCVSFFDLSIKLDGINM